VKNVSSSPALPPTQQDAIALHHRLLVQDPTAANDLADAYLERLVAWLSETDPNVAEDIRLESAEDAILALIRKPESYSPERQTLEVYLRMSARGDLRNLLSKEQRHKKGRIHVELLPDAGKYLGRNDDPSLPLRLAEEKQNVASAIGIRPLLRAGRSRVLHGLMAVAALKRQALVNEMLAEMAFSAAGSEARTDRIARVRVARAIT
jgi:hypothetical protein